MPSYKFHTCPFPFIKWQNFLCISRKKIIITFCISCITFAASGQHADVTGTSSFPNSYPADSLSKLRVRNIVIKGNKKTKDYIILRELDFEPGDSILIVNMEEQLQKARDRVYNTTLFIEVKVTPEIISASAFDIYVTVKERWYIFPNPWFQRDIGYVYSEPGFVSKLSNKFLYSGGFGIDILTLYDFKLSIECSFNQLGQKGLFLHN